MQSAGILSPSERNTTSPGTSSVLFINIFFPFLNVLTFGDVKSFNAFIVFSVFHSCIKVIDATKPTNTNIIAPSLGAPNKKYTVVAINKSKNIGSLNTPKNFFNIFGFS